jgi:hypothetical protein
MVANVEKFQTRKIFFQLPKVFGLGQLAPA